MRQLVRFTWILALAALPGISRAQQPDTPDTLEVQGPPIEVTALRGRDRIQDIPAATFVLSRDSMCRTGASRIATLLQTLPGLFAYQQTGSGDPGVVDPRGFTANGEISYLKLLVDGQDVRDVENGNVDWDWVLPEDAERVEVIEGAGAWLYGDGAEGGIVNVVQPAIRDGLHSDCAARFGSFGFGTGSLVLTGRKDDLAGSLRGQLRQADGWRDHSGERVYGGRALGRWSLASQASLAVNASYLDSDRQDPGTLSRAQFDDDRTQAQFAGYPDFTHARRLVLGGDFRLAEHDRSGFHVSPYYRTEDTDRIRTLPLFPGAFQSQFHPTRAWTVGSDAGWQHEARFGERVLAVTIGSQVERSTLHSDYAPFDPGTRITGDIGARVRSFRTAYAGFASARFDVVPGTTARLGVRGDGIRVDSKDDANGTSTSKRTFEAMSPFVAVSQRIGESFAAYASFSTAYHTPTLNQLFDQFFPGAVSNPQLDPQRSVSVEGGGRWDGPRGAFASVTLYDVRVRNEIDFDATTFSYQNIGRSRHRGVQVSGAHPIGAFVSVRASGTYSPTLIRGGDNDGHQINAVPKRIAYAGLALSLPAEVSLEGGVRYVGRQFLDKENEHPLGSFANAEAAASARLGRLRGTFRVANLLDRRYADTGFVLFGEDRLVPATERSYSVALSFD